MYAFKRNNQSMGLQAFFNHNPKLQYYVKTCLMAWPLSRKILLMRPLSLRFSLVWSHKNEEGFDYLNEKLKDPQSYFEQTYIDVVGGRLRSRQQPIFAVDAKIKYKDVIEDVDINSNKMEGFNSRQVSSTSKQPSIYILLEGFFLKETGAKTTIDENIIAVGGNCSLP
jgi:hypothetical protein